MDAGAGHTPCLPPEVLTHLLQYVDLQQRLGSCAVVSRTWRAAAVAATTTIDVRLKNESIDSMQAWLQQNGSSVCSLTLVAFWKNLQVPFLQLQHLEQLSLRFAMLSDTCVPESSSNFTSASHAPRTLGALTSLTSLQLEDVTLPSVAYLAPLSALTNLRRLQLEDIKLGSGSISSVRCSAVSLAQLPLGLTRLVLKKVRDRELSSSSTPGLAQLIGLKQLVVQAIGSVLLHPEVLKTLLQLTRLDLTRCLLVPENGAGTAALLGVLPLFTQLQHLDLTFTLDHAAPQAQSYTALVPPTLTYLDLRDCWLPAAAAQHMFSAAPGRQRPGLRILHLDLGDWQYQGQVTDDDPLGFNALDSGDLCSLVHCLPGLQELNLVDTVQADLELTALLQLTGLTTLTVEGAAVNDSTAAGVLAQLTGLQRLHLLGSTEFTDAGLVRLACLTRLQRLEVYICESDSTLDLHSMASPADVWQQLRAHCVNCNSRLRIMLEQLEEKLDTAAGASAAKEEELKQQLAAAQQQADTAQQQASQLQQQLAQAQQQLAGVQEQAAELQLQLAQAQR